MTDTNRYADSFRLLDADGDGKVSAAELIQMMRNLGENVTEEAATKAVEIMDSDGDGLRLPGGVLHLPVGSRRLTGRRFGAASERAPGNVERVFELNDEQRAAATFDGGPLRILAGAGTGKTTTLTRPGRLAGATGACRPTASCC